MEEQSERRSKRERMIYISGSSSTNFRLGVKIERKEKLDRAGRRWGVPGRQEEWAGLLSALSREE